MSKKYGLILVVLLLVAGYFTYQRWTGPLAAWRYIPPSASLVVSSNRLQDSAFYDPGGYMDYKKMPIIRMAAGNLSILNWFNSDPAQVNAFLKNKTITYSFHPRSNNLPGVILFIPVASEKEEQWLENPKIKGTRSIQHTFQDHSITDVSDEKSRNLFSYIQKGGYLVVSQYGELIEDVIRKSASGFPSLRSFANDSRSDLTIYLRDKSWKSFLLPAHTGENLQAFFALMPDFQDYHLEKSKEADSLVSRFKASGGTIENHPYSEWFDGLQGAPFTGSQYISQQTIYFIRAAGGNKEKFQRNYRRWMRNQRTTPAVRQLDERIGKDKDLLLNNIGSELILCLNEKSNSLNDSKILLADFGNYDQIRPLLTRLSSHSEASGISNFQGYDIYSVPVPELPKALFGPVFSGFPKAFVTYVAPYLVIGNNSQSVRNYLIDFENQLTWAQSPEYDSLGTLLEPGAQLALIVNLQKAGATTGISPDLPGAETLLLSCRFSGTTVHTGIALNPRRRTPANLPINQTVLKVDLEWPGLYDSTVTAMLNPMDGTSEILLTDPEHNLLEISNLTTEKPQVLTRLDGPLVTKTYKADFLNIGRQQRIVSTSSQLYLIDENDEGLITALSDPITSPWPIKELFRVNGASESSSRFIAKDARNNLYLWERVHKRPFKLNHSISLDKIASPVVSFQHGNTNLFAVTQQNGKVIVLDENGHVRKGFPADMLSRTQGAFTWTQNPLTTEIELIGVSTQGELTRIDMNGKIVLSQQLIRPEASSVFRTLFDDNTLDWLLLRTTGSKAAILNKAGDVLFEMVNLRPNARVRYHFFGSDNRFITVQSGKYTSLFDLNGRLLGDKPIPSEGGDISLSYQAAQYELLVFSKVKGKFQIWSIKLR